MSAAAIFIGGWLAGVLTVVVAAIIGMRWIGDPLDDRRDEHAQGHGIGGADFFQHRQPTTNRERNDHA